jgi:hypothetical protein
MSERARVIDHAYVLDPNGNNIEAVHHGDAPSRKGRVPR